MQDLHSFAWYSVTVFVTINTHNFFINVKEIKDMYIWYVLSRLLSSLWCNTTTIFKKKRSAPWNTFTFEILSHFCFICFKWSNQFRIVILFTCYYIINKFIFINIINIYVINVNICNLKNKDLWYFFIDYFHFVYFSSFRIFFMKLIKMIINRCWCYKFYMGYVREKTI